MGSLDKFRGNLVIVIIPGKGRGTFLLRSHLNSIHKERQKRKLVKEKWISNIRFKNEAGYSRKLNIKLKDMGANNEKDR